MSQFKITVIIPVRNGGHTLSQCLSSLRMQTLGHRLQLLILDSMSTDNSREIAKGYGAEVVEVPSGTFNHGFTRNTGVQQAQADLVFFTVQDARLSDNTLLERMAKHFADEALMAVCGHQAVPHEKDKNPVFWRKTYSQPEVTVKHLANGASYERLPQSEQRALVAWDNVVSMYRRSALLEQPFVKTDFAEDWIWSYQALLKGWKLLHDPSLVVYHYHHSSFTYTFRVHYTINYHFYREFHFVPAPPALAKTVIERSYHLLKNRELSSVDKLYWTFHNAGSVIAAKFSVLNFLIRLRIGGVKSLKKGYDKYCKIIPQGKQKAKGV